MLGAPDDVVALSKAILLLFSIKGCGKSAEVAANVFN